MLDNVINHLKRTITDKDAKIEDLEMKLNLSHIKLSKCEDALNRVANSREISIKFNLILTVILISYVIYTTN